MERIASNYMHIDNGGISVEVSREDHVTKISMSTQYHGYPFMESSLQGHLSPSDVKRIGETLMEAAIKMDLMASEE